MSNSNHNNRGEYGLHIGAVAATKRLIALVALKKVRIHKASIIDTTAVPISAVNYMQLILKKNDADVDVLVDTQLGVAARVEIPMSLDASLDYLDLEKGDVLEVVLTKVAAGAFTMANLQMDVEVIGN